VQVRQKKDGSERRFVTKKDLVEKGDAAFDKDFLARFTLAHPQVFRNFKIVRPADSGSLSLDDLLRDDVTTICQHLEQRLLAIQPGADGASDYHRTVVGILDFLFFPRVFNPIIEEEIHEGRKRIDVVFDNGATEGFFFRLSHQTRLPCPYIFVECKNYREDIRNPEIDQLAGRFSPNRGQFGLVICRSLENEELALNRCRDTYTDRRGLILPITDTDLIHSLQATAKGDPFPLEVRLNELFRRVAL
jgi:hypothetical protein